MLNFDLYDTPMMRRAAILRKRRKQVSTVVLNQRGSVQVRQRKYGLAYSIIYRIPDAAAPSGFRQVRETLHGCESEEEVRTILAAKVENVKHLRLKPKATHLEPRVDFLTKLLLPTGNDSFIYCLQAQTSGLIKIGFAKNPYSRFSNYRTHNPDGLVLLGIWHGNRNDEEQIHERFKHQRHSREWFTPGADLLEFIKAHSAV
jgi:hypothetical protein